MDAVTHMHSCLQQRNVKTTAVKRLLGSSNMVQCTSNDALHVILTVTSCNYSNKLWLCKWPKCNEDEACNELTIVTTAAACSIQTTREEAQQLQDASQSS